MTASLPQVLTAHLNPLLSTCSSSPPSLLAAILRGLLDHWHSVLLLVLVAAVTVYATLR